MKRNLIAVMMGVLSLNAFASEQYNGNGYPMPQTTTLEIVDYDGGGTLENIRHKGKVYVVGDPGHRYGLRVCNNTNERVLTVLSVDGLNVITGEKANPSQNGYVLNPQSCADVRGWRKNQKQVAEFYFTNPGDTYSERSGKGGRNLGVIGMATFFEKPQPPIYSGPMGMAKEAMDSLAGAPSAAARNKSEIGTGHGNRIESRSQNVEFERDSQRGPFLSTVTYDTRENLVRRGVIRERQQGSYDQNAWPGQYDQRYAQDPKW